MKTTVWMFSGQGSQFYGMGRELFEKEPIFRSAMERGDSIVRDLIHESVIEIIYGPRENKFEAFHSIRYTHPAIFLVEYAMAQVLLDRGLRPDSLLGYSLGELTALAVAEAVTFDEALVSIVKQATLLEYLAPGGGMLAILSSPDIAQRFPDLFRDVEIAAYNFPNNFVVTGSTPALRELHAGLRQREITAVELPVDHPFHSRAMTCVDAPFRALLEKVSVRAPNIPVISAEKAETISSGWGHQLLDGTRNRVDLASTVRHLEQHGEYLYVDLGPSGSMATAIKYNLPKSSKSEFFPLITLFGQDLRNLDRVLAQCRPATSTQEIR